MCVLVFVLSCIVSESQQALPSPRLEPKFIGEGVKSNLIKICPCVHACTRAESCSWKSRELIWTMALSWLVLLVPRLAFSSHVVSCR